MSRMKCVCLCGVEEGVVLKKGPPSGCLCVFVQEVFFSQGLKRTKSHSFVRDRFVGREREKKGIFVFGQTNNKIKEELIKRWDGVVGWCCAYVFFEQRNR